MKALVTCPFIPIVPRMASHRSAQGVIYADQLRQTGKYGVVDINWSGKAHEDHNEYDHLYVYHGSDWGGTLNLFGGVQSFPYAWNIRNFSKFKGKVFSLGIDFPPYHEFIGNRISDAAKNGKEIQAEFQDTDLKNLERMHDEAETVLNPHVTSKLVIGDSHSICMYRPGWTVYSVPFKTLNGTLNLKEYDMHGNLYENFACYIQKLLPIDQVTDAEFYFGNIDVRHHLCRLEGSPVVSATDLAIRYVDAVEALPISKVSIYELLPIEDESRKLPKTGYYKGKPFWGSWDQREHVRRVFNDAVKNYVRRAKFIEWTGYLKNAQGQLDFKFMEKPHSIHLSREFYPFWQGDKVINKVVTPTPDTSSLASFFV